MCFSLQKFHNKNSKRPCPDGPEKLFKCSVVNLTPVCIRFVHMKNVLIPLCLKIILSFYINITNSRDWKSGIYLLPLRILMWKRRMLMYFSSFKFNFKHIHKLIAIYKPGEGNLMAQKHSRLLPWEQYQTFLSQKWHLKSLVYIVIFFWMVRAFVAMSTAWSKFQSSLASSEKMFSSWLSLS